MINSIYRLFYEKQPESINAFIPVDNLSVTFLIPYIKLFQVNYMRTLLI